MTKLKALTLSALAVAAVGSIMATASPAEAVSNGCRNYSSHKGCSNYYANNTEWISAASYPNHTVVGSNSTGRLVWLDKSDKAHIATDYNSVGPIPDQNTIWRACGYLSSGQIGCSPWVSHF